MRQPFNSGFTLIELMITVAVLGIIAAIATPSFTAVIEQNRSSKAANEMVGQLNLLRAEALRRSTTVTLCRANDDATDCADDNDPSWSHFLAYHGEAPGSGGENVLLVRRLGGGLDLSITGITNNLLVIARNGTLGAGNASPSLSISTSSKTANRGQCLQLNASGRSQVSKGECVND